MSACEDSISCVFAYFPQALEVAFTVVAAASAIAAITPTPSDDMLIGKIYRLIDALALNVGYAKQKKPPKGGRFVPS